jgi:hypothetical protein
VRQYVEKTVDYYMSLHYQVELEREDDFGPPEIRASIKELRGCGARIGGTDSVEKLWRLLEENKRKWITKRLESGQEVPEPSSVDRDPFWQEFPDEFDQHDVRQMMYESGLKYFPLRVLQAMWLRELKEVGLSEVEPSVGAPPKAETPHGDQTISTLDGDVRPVRLDKSRKKVWIKFDGPRTERGYKYIEVLDQPLRTEAAIVAALTTLEASMIQDADFKRLREALLKHVEAHPGLREKPLQEVLNELPPPWFIDQRSNINNELAEKREKDLKRDYDEKQRDKQRRKRFKKKYSWERSPILWERSVRYMVALLRYRRPDFDKYPLEQQLDMVSWHRKRINEFLEKQREHMAFVEYGTPTGTPTRVGEQAQDQVMAAVLKDVDGLSHLEIAEILGVEYDEDRYKSDMKIPAVTGLIDEGRGLLGAALRSEGGWQKRAEEMKKEGKRYRSLTEEEKEVEQLAENNSWTVEQARSYRETSPGWTKLRTYFSPPRKDKNA